MIASINADLIFADKLDNQILLAIKLENFLHKLFYNAWFLVNIENKTIDKTYFEILKDEIGFDEKIIDKRMNYYTMDEKYYAPSYPLGAYFVEKAIKELGIHNLDKIYLQHSTNTLKKLKVNTNGQT
jgi:hypothetical protein